MTELENLKQKQHANKKTQAKKTVQRLEKDKYEECLIYIVLGAFAIVRKANISFVMANCPSVRLSA